MRTVLVVTLACFIACVASCAGSDEVATKPTPVEVIDAIKKLGGSVKVDENKAVVNVDLAGTKVTDSELVHLKRFTELRNLDLDNTHVTGRGLVYL